MYPDYDDMAPALEVKTKIEREIKPAYVLGQADPVAFVRDKSNDEKHKAKKPVNFMSGVDTRIYVDGEPLHVAQAIEMKYSKITKMCEGTLILIGSPGMEENKKFLAKDTCHVMVKAADEYGNTEVSFDEKIQIKGYAWGVAIDDIITETIVSFEVFK